MVNHNYNIFSKKELVSFLEKHERNFRYVGTPYDIMLEAKMDDLSKLIDENLKKSTRLREEYQRTTDGASYLMKSKKLYDEWKKLDNEYDRLSKLRFGDTVKA